MGLRRRKYYLADFGWLCANKRDFYIKKSRYSDVITTIDGDRKESVTYTDSKTNNKIFSIVRKIKKEVEPSLAEINRIVSKKDFSYFSTGSDLGSFCSDSVSNIDLNSAYLTVLHRDGIIGDHLHELINDLPKVERLKVLGLLAYEPDVFEFRNGEPYKEYTQKNPFKNVFFYAVNGVSEAMHEAKRFLKDDFIFFWVDGIYFSDENYSTGREVQYLLEKRGFKTHFEQLINFNFQADNEKYIKIDFVNPSFETKKFNVRTDHYQKKVAYGLAMKNYFSDRTPENFEKLYILQNQQSRN